MTGEPARDGTRATGRDALSMADLLEGRDLRQDRRPDGEPGEPADRGDQAGQAGPGGLGGQGGSGGPGGGRRAGPSPGHDLVPVRAGMAEAPHLAYRALFARIDEGRALVEEAQARLDAARAELAAVERLAALVDERGYEMWSRVRRRMGRRGRALEPLPAPDPDALPETNVDGLLDEAAADVAGDAQRPLALRVPRPLALPLCGLVSGAVGYLFARLWVGLTGVNVAGALGLVALVLAPLVGVAVALHWRARYHDEPVETEPGPALVGFAFAALAEAALFAATH